MMNAKRAVLERLLGETWVAIGVDPRTVGVVLPESLREKTAVCLHIGHDMPTPVRDLVIDDDGVSCTLSFERQLHPCRLPWSSIFSLTDVSGRRSGEFYDAYAPPEWRGERGERAMN